jgi:hypothetical protein
VRAVWKYPVMVADEFTVTMPETHTVVHVALQGAQAQMWVEVDTDSETWPTTFHVEGTGHPIKSDSIHVGSWIEGPFVWHLYEVQR